MIWLDAVVFGVLAVRAFILLYGNSTFTIPGSLFCLIGLFCEHVVARVVFVHTESH